MSSILDAKVPEIGVDVLKPTKYIKPKPKEIKKNMTSWYDWLVSHAPEDIRRPVSDAYKQMKDRVMYLFKETKAKGSIEINGEKLTAKQALTKYPQLRGFLQGKRKISEKSLESKLRTWMRDGKIPNEIFDPEPEIVSRGRLLGNNVLGQYTIHSKVYTSPRDFLNSPENVIIKFLKERPQNKVQLSLVCVMVRFDPTTGKIAAEEQAYFNSAIEIVYESTDLNEVYERMKTKILESFSTYLKNGSGWVLKKVVKLDITLSKFKPLRGSSHIPLPKVIEKKKAVISIRNNDDQCFKWASTRALFPVEKNAGRVTEELREQAETLNWDGIEFPTPCSERYFEKFGKNNVSVLVFGYDEKKIIPLYVPKVMREKLFVYFFKKVMTERKIIVM